ncbi:MAG: carboxypeptidase-like regulatory domain-containing protein [Chitinophagales bacterium]|nr:carboxypeptidase-like regulatory domain-containing protein [Chitinophagales bacterium]MDW8428699.1 carboxypeptidase-like regulatory domain-containing protein [Chitinophagales bacterium]
MNYLPSSFRLISLFVFLFFQQAQAQFGHITGIVTDGQLNEVLTGATVFLENDRSRGAITDVDGLFTIRNVPVGMHNLVVQYVSYQTKVIEQVYVAEEKTTEVQVVLLPMAKDLEEVVVRSELKKESINALLILQKNSTLVQDGISSDLIRRSPDKNAAEAMKRVSGVSLAESKFAIIRGLSDRYNLALINGTPLPSTEADRKNFTFDLIPSNLIDNIIVYKTAQPDLPGDFAGGVIQVNTRDIPDRKFFNLSLSSGFNSISTFRPWYDYQGGKLDFLGLDDGSRALPSDFPPTEIVQQALTEDIIAYSQMLPNNWALFRHPSMMPNYSGQFSAGMGNPQFGGIISITYNRSQRFNQNIRQDFDFLETNPKFRYLDSAYATSVLAGALFNIGWRISAMDKITFKNSYTINSSDLTTVRGGQNIEQQFDVRNYAYEFVSNQLYNSQLLGEHALFKSRLRIQWYGAYSLTRRDQPDFRKLYYNRNSGSADPFLAYIPVGSASPNLAGKFYAYLQEDAYSGEVKLTYHFNVQERKNALRTGLFYQHRNRVFDARVLGYTITNFIKFYTENEDPNAILSSAPGDLFQSNHIGEAGFSIDEITNPSDHYEGQSNLTATYLMMDQQALPWLRLIYGARLEFFHQRLQSFDYTNRPVDVNTYSRDIGNLPFDLLPSINAIFKVTENANLRAAFSKTAVRPEFRELAPFSFYDFSTTSVIIGNDTLARSNIYNYDLRFEVFPGSGQVFSIGAFYKKFHEPIEQTIDFISSGGYIRSYRNVTSARNYGMEVDARKQLSFLSHWWHQMENIVLQLNAAWIRSVADVSLIANAADSTRSLQGQSPYIINLGISYMEPTSETSVTLLFNQIGRRIMFVGSSEYMDIYEHSRPLVDLQLSRRIITHGTLRLNIHDLLARDGILYQDVNDDGRFRPDDDKEIVRSKTGTVISLGFSYSF